MELNDLTLSSLTSGQWDGSNCRECAPNYYGQDCKTFCSDEGENPTCGIHGMCSSTGSCVCDDQKQLTLRNVNLINGIDINSDKQYTLEINNVLDNTKNNWLIFKRLTDFTNKFIIE